MNSSNFSASAFTSEFTDAAFAVNAFRKTGLFPCNPLIFDEHEFQEQIHLNQVSDEFENHLSDTRIGRDICL
jgi:hypothetical protein